LLPTEINRIADSGAGLARGRPQRGPSFCAFRVSGQRERDVGRGEDEAVLDRVVADLPGSALTLIEAEVCESFDPPLRADEHRRNLVTRGVELNGLVGREFMIGDVRCRGMRLCEPCRVMDGYASRPLLRALVHRGGLRADILEDGEIHVGDRISVYAHPSPT
jgi:MOSC domain-containing protein YiiM